MIRWLLPVPATTIALEAPEMLPEIVPPSRKSLGRLVSEGAAEFTEPALLTTIRLIFCSCTKRGSDAGKPASVADASPKLSADRWQVAQVWLLPRNVSLRNNVAPCLTMLAGPGSATSPTPLLTAATGPRVLEGVGVFNWKSALTLGVPKLLKPANRLRL